MSSSELMRKQRLLKAALARLPGVKFYCGDYRVSATAAPSSLPFNATATLDAMHCIFAGKCMQLTSE